MSKTLKTILFTTVIVLAVILGLNYFRLLTRFPQAPDRLADRYEQSKYFPYDPQSPMVSSLSMNYAISGILVDKKQISEGVWQLILGLPNDPVNLAINVDAKDNPKIVDTKQQPLTLEQVTTHFQTTVSLTYEKKTNQTKVYYIYVQQ